MATKRINCADREMWLAARTQGVGASEVGTILGVNPFETPRDLWLRKTGKVGPQEETFAMKRGHYLEDAVSKFFHDETGYDVIENTAQDFIVYQESREWLRVSPDRYYWLGDSRSDADKGILECKTTLRDIDAEDLPKTWFAQLQYQMGVCEKHHGHLAWLTASREFGCKDIPFDEEFYGFIVEQVERFWFDCVKGGKEPEAIRASDILAKYPGSIANAKALDDALSSEEAMDIAAACNDYHSVADEIKKLEARKEELENKIKMMFDSCEAITLGGRTLATWKSAKASESFDKKAFQDKYPDIYKEFVTTKEGSRRFLVK